MNPQWVIAQIFTTLNTTLIKTIKNLFTSKTTHLELIGLPADNRLYCIGDIHGREDLLAQLHDLIYADAEDYSGSKTIVYLGDYIDRGPDSKQVIDLLIDNQQLNTFKKVYLLGNHEQVLLQFLHTADPNIANDWFKFGGISTLMSYGVQLRGIPTLKDLPRIRTELAKKIPTEHIKFYQNLALSYESGDYFFVHAGVKPKIKLDNQSQEDLLWIRDEFINSNLFHGRIIVHGHTVKQEPELLSNRIGIDTGAYNTGVLTSAVFEGFDCKFIQTNSR